MARSSVFFFFPKVFGFARAVKDDEFALSMYVPRKDFCCRIRPSIVFYISRNRVRFLCILSMSFSFFQGRLNETVDRFVNNVKHFLPGGGGDFRAARPRWRLFIIFIASIAVACTFILCVTRNFAPPSLPMLSGLISVQTFRAGV